MAGTIISTEASIALGAVDFGVRQLISASTKQQTSTNTSTVSGPSPGRTVTGKVVSNPYGKTTALNNSIPSIIIRKPYYGHVL